MNREAFGVVVTFCGHRDCIVDDAMKKWLRDTIEELIAQGASTFYLGGYGRFDRAAAFAVWELKRSYPHIRSVLVLPYLDRKVNAELYDCTTYPPLESVPRRFAISKRNEWMVDEADVIVAFVAHDWGGAAAALAYAVRKRKVVRNYADEAGAYR